MASQSGQAGGTPSVKNFTARALAIYNPYFQAAGPEWSREAIFDGTESIGYALEEACAASFNHQDNVTCDIFHKQLKLFIDVCREQSPSVVYLYICTHGVRDQDGRLYLMMKDSPDPNSANLDEFIQSSISGKDLVHYIQQLQQDNAGKVIVLLDCCHAGALLYDWVLPLGPNITGALKNDAARSAVKGGSGLLIFMSCNKDESSKIYYNHTGPLFTKAVATTLLEPPRQKIEVKKLITKVQEKVQWSSSDRQHPTFWCTDNHPEKLGYLGICSTESLGDEPMDISVTGGSLGLQSTQNPGVRVVMPRNTKPPESTSTTISAGPMNYKELRTLSKRLIRCWEDLACELGVDQFTIQEISMEQSSPSDKACKMLVAWSENCPVESRRSMLIRALRQLNQGVLAGDLEAGDF